MWPEDGTAPAAAPLAEVPIPPSAGTTASERG
jgi:hypothetical protein